MHNFEEPYRTNKRKIRVHGKWELVLVLLVVIAGIIVTTIAITKAKGMFNRFSCLNKHNLLHKTLKIYFRKKKSKKLRFQFSKLQFAQQFAYSDSQQ